MDKRVPPIILSLDRGTLLLSGIYREQVQAIFSPETWTWDQRVSAWRCEAYRYAAIREQLNSRMGGRFVDSVPTPCAVNLVSKDPLERRPEPAQALVAC